MLLGVNDGGTKGEGVVSFDGKMWQDVVYGQAGHRLESPARRPLLGGSSESEGQSSSARAAGRRRPQRLGSCDRLGYDGSRPFWPTMNRLKAPPCRRYERPVSREGSERGTQAGCGQSDGWSWAPFVSTERTTDSQPPVWHIMQSATLVAWIHDHWTPVGTYRWRNCCPSLMRRGRG